MANFSFCLSIVVLIAFCIINAQAAAQTQLEATGNKDASKNQFPYVVSVQTRSYQHICGGSIINSRWVLTAGNCVANRVQGTLLARAGSNNYRLKGDLYEIATIRVHPLFNINSLQNDIAVIQTSQHIRFSVSVHPISISTFAIQPKNILTIPSWSYKGLYPGSQISENLQYNTGKAIETTTCLAQLTKAGYLPFVYAINICTESTKNGICRGSEGGPLVLNGSLHGVVSYSKGCTGQLPDVHTRIQPYAQWVWQTVNQYQ